MNIQNKAEQTREEMINAAEARKRRRRRSNIRAAVILIGILIILAAVVCGGMLLFSELKKRGEAQSAAKLSELEGEQEREQESKLSDPDEETAVPADSKTISYSQEELDAKIAEAVASAQNAEAERVLEGIKQSLSEGTTTVETLRPYYPDEIVVVSGGRFHFVPINEELAHNQLDISNLNILETGEYQYMTDGAVTSHKGIDVSSHQGDIDWNLAAQDGVEFAFIRVGFRGYGTGKLVEDEKFEDNIKGAKAAGVKVGVYFFSQAVTEAEVLEEAGLVLEKISPYALDCPVVFDVEKVSGSGRMNELSVEERTNLTLLFCQTIENAGYKPMIYHNTEMGALMIDLAALEGYDKWYASYSDQMFYPYEYKVWQYSDKGNIQGIKTAVDLNISFAPIWEE